MPRFVLEIGAEEIPPRFFPPALAQLRADAASMLARARLSVGEIEVYGAPRRLVLIAEDLAATQAPAVREERGPPARAAFDSQGNPTRAAEGFARRHGLTPSDLVVRKTDQGDYVFAEVHEPEAPAAQALAPLLPALISGLSFPKSMRWGAGALRFGRPIRWLLALLDDQVVAFPLGDLTSGRLTRGHPALADGLFPVDHAAHYEPALRARFVIADPAERRALIEQAVRSISAQHQARAVDGGLLDETAFLVEWPSAACGRFDPAFLSLPRPVLVEEMQRVQSYFPLEDQKGDLLPRFIAVRDGGDDHLDRILAGWESVLRAKLIDASYFYQQDLKCPLADRVDALQGVIFQESLGSMFDKVERVRRIAGTLAEAVGLSAADAAALDRAALLCKADLTTAMVAELSSLQGLMGREYALASGESLGVADAIGEHYRPRFAGDDAPHTILGRLLALADKADTIVSCFSVGLLPTGSADPYGLRREANGVVTILVASGEDRDPSASLTVSLSHIIRSALDALSAQSPLQRARDEVTGDVIAFLRQRLATSLRDDGVRYDLVDAALAVGLDDIGLAWQRAHALERLQGRSDFLPTVIATTRASNIVKGYLGGQPDPSFFSEQAESALWQAYQEVLQAAAGASLLGLFDLFSRLRAPIDRYFDDVLVMAEDERLRENRLATCWTINQLFRRLADFTLVVQADQG